MKYLVTGLGNFGEKYEKTRHNIGFEVVDYLAEKHGGSFIENTQGFTAEIKYRGRIIHLLKPTTYMNLSGKAIRYWLTKHNIPIERSLVILDDVNLDTGIIKLKPKGSDGGHNGLKHIQQMLGTTKYPRLRIGIGRDFPPGGQVQYVLGKWEASELKVIQEAIEKSAKATLQFAALGIQRAMTTVN